MDLNGFSNSESPCHPNASHEVSAQSDFWFGRRSHLKNFLDKGPKRFYLAILNLYVAPISPMKFQLNPTFGLGDVI